MVPRNLLATLSLAALLATTPTLLHAQPTVDCDSIAIGDIRYSAFDAGIIEVPAAALNGACVGYPSFNLYDQNGDTLAKETVNFFCLSFGPWLGIHELQVFPGANLGTGPQLLTLELFSGFGDTLVCAWDLMVDLCPPDSCVYAQLTFSDWHDQLVQDGVYWFLEDPLGGTVGSGVFQMDGVNRNAEDSVCIAPGTDYYLWVSPFTQVNVFDSINLAVSSNGGITSLINYHQNDSFPSDMFFDWYGDCADGTNAILEVEQPSFQAWQHGAWLFIQQEQIGQFQELRLLDGQGQAVRSLPMSGERSVVNVEGLAPGVYIVQALARSGVFAARKVWVR